MMILIFVNVIFITGAEHIGHMQKKKSEKDFALLIINVCMCVPMCVHMGVHMA